MAFPPFGNKLFIAEILSILSFYYSDEIVFEPMGLVHLHLICEINELLKFAGNYSLPLELSEVER